jgi:hypothetical protein
VCLIIIIITIKGSGGALYASDSTVGIDQCSMTSNAVVQQIEREEKKKKKKKKEAHI